VIFVDDVFGFHFFKKVFFGTMTSRSIKIFIEQGHQDDEDEIDDADDIEFRLSSDDTKNRRLNYEEIHEEHDEKASIHND